MSPRLRVYVTLVVLNAIGLLAYFHPADLEQRWAHYVLWTLICFISEMLWLSTLSGEGTASMASTSNLATLILWGPGASIWIVGVSTLLAHLLLQRKPWVRASFNAGQSVITVWVSGAVMSALGGPAAGLRALDVAIVWNEVTATQMAVAFLGLATTYFLVNRGLVALAVAWSTDRAYVRVLREDWFYRERLLDDLALTLLAPLAVISYEAIGYLGMLLFYTPLRIIYESHKRYLELRKTQNHLIHTERMAAKGEMAAEIGHELRNQLAGISGRAQMLLKDAEREAFASVPRHAQIILDQTRRMESMSKGLMDFSSAELKMERLDLNGLIQRSVEIVRPQNRFDSVEWDLKLYSGMPDMRADPGQIQDVLINLFMNAADAMSENGKHRKRIVVTTEFDERIQQVRLVVTDTGSGIKSTVLPKVFEPHFTTKVDGHGFGLSTSYRIITNHGGQISASSPPGAGATFTITLPQHGPGSWS